MTLAVRVEKLVTAYLSTEACKDREQYILNPDKNRAVLANHYADNKTCKSEFQTVDSSDCAKPIDGHCGVTVVVGKRLGARGQSVEDKIS
ncbi:MAG: hypothetical protein ACM34E_14800, partial [Acidobacteriota bacterium]